MFFVAGTVTALWCVVVANGQREPVYRLPTTVLPTQYTLAIKTDPFGTKFSGKVIIDVDIHEDTSNITLHSKNLNLKTVELQKCQEGVQKIHSNFSLDQKRDLILVQSSRLLKSYVCYRLTIVFEGKLLLSEPRGYYRIKTGAADTDWMSSTTFERVHAREAFPCWDEPQFKAKFRLSLIHRHTHQALSNMPLVSSSQLLGEKGWVVDNFDNSLLMSSYLVAFHLLQWNNTEIKTDDGRSLRLWASSKDLSLGSKHLEFAKRALSWLQNYTDLPEPMPKIDIVMVPGLQYAIENWGVISGGSNIILRQPKTILTHELAHSWFGNMVSPAWWDGLWLSEGAATFITALAKTELIAESPDLLDEVMDYQLGMYYGNKDFTAQPLTPRIDYMDELLKMPAMAYYQGCSLFYMLYHLKGPNGFRAGVQRYLSNLQFDNATPEKLYQNLDYEWNNKTLSELMSEWTYQAGFPVVTVVRSPSQLTLTQERFIAGPNMENGSQTEIEGKDTKWWVPITFTSQTQKNFKDTRPKLWLRDTMTIPDPEGPQGWILLNIRAYGMYIVKYDNTTLQMIRTALMSKNHGGIPALMRAKIFMDCSLLYHRGEVDLAELLDMLQWVDLEDHKTPWRTAVLIFGKLSQKLSGTHAGTILRGELFRIMGNMIQRKQLSMLRSQIGQSACLFGLPKCVRKSAKLFQQWTEQPQPDKINPIPQGTRLVVYCSAMRSPGTTFWGFLQERALRSQDSLHRETMFTALGCTENYHLHYSLLESQTKNSTMTERDWSQLLKGMVQYNTAVDPVLGYLRDAQSTLQATMQTKMVLDANVLKGLADQAVKPSHLQQITDIVLQAGWNKQDTKEHLAGLTGMIEHQIRWRELNKQVFS